MIRGMATVRIDQDYWDELDEDGRQRIVGWGLVIAGESMIDGETSGPVFLGQDGGKESRHVGTWSTY